MVKALELVKFDSRSFENPALQKHYASLQAMALDRENIDSVIDYVVPDEKGMSKYSPIVEEFKESAFPPGYDPNQFSTKKAASKKRKGEDGEQITLNESNIQDIIRNDQLKKFTVPELKEYIKSQNIKIGSKTKKDELIAKIKENAATRASDPKHQLQKANSNSISNINDFGSNEDIHSDDEQELHHKSKKIKVAAKHELERHENQNDDLENTSPMQHSSTSSPLTRSQSEMVTKVEEEDESKPMCMYGSSCYRKNPQHFKEFRHPNKPNG